MDKKIFNPRILIIVAVMAALITGAGIYFHQSFIRILPLYNSLFVMILSANVNRYAYLCGGLNSILYAIIYFSYGLYGVAAQAMLFSFPMQIITFFRWKKNADKKSVKFKSMTPLQLFATAAAYIAAWVGLYFILRHFGSDYAVLDNTATLLGILITFLTALAYIEYTWLMIPSGLINIILYISMLPEHPEQATYLIYSLYSFVCITIQFINARKVYKKQRSETADRAPVQ